MDDVACILELRLRDIVNDIITVLSHRELACGVCCHLNHSISGFLVISFSSLLDNRLATSVLNYFKMMNCGF